MSGDQNFLGNTAADHARQHNGHVYSNVYNYVTPTGQSPTPELLKLKKPDSSSAGRGLLYAARTGSLENVERYLTHDINLNFADSDGRTALHWAAKNGHEGIARALIEANCKIESFSEEHGTPLCEAARAGKASIIQQLLRAGANVNAPGGWHGSAIHAACVSNSLDTLVLLLDAGASVDTIRTTTSLNEYGNTISKGFKFIRRACKPLYVASSSGSANLIPILLSSGADMNALSKTWYAKQPHESYEATAGYKSKSAPIHAAASSPSVACLKIFIDQNVDIHSKASDGRTPLHFAGKHGRAENLQVLCDKGSDIHSLDDFQQTAVFNASTRQCVEFLVRLGAQVNTRNKFGRTPLMQHAWKWRHESVEALLDLGVPVDETGTNGHTALFYANSQKCIELLVRRGAQIRVRSKSGKTPLIYQAQYGRQTPVEVLLDLGSSINEKDNSGNTALDRAKQNGHKDLVKYLKQQGGRSGHLFG